MHVYELTATAARAEIRVLLRDFDEQLLAGHEELLRRAVAGGRRGRPGRRDRGRRPLAVPQHATLPGVGP